MVPSSVSSVSSPAASTSSDVTATPGSADANLPEQASTAECGKYQELVLEFEIDQDTGNRYRWWLTLHPGEPGLFKLESGDKAKSWTYDVPADADRDFRLCTMVADHGAKDGEKDTDDKRAYAAITLGSGEQGRSELDEKTAAGFEDDVLDSLPPELLENIMADFRNWLAQQSGSTSGGDRTTVQLPGASSPGGQCAALVLGTMTVTNGENDPATFYEWELEFDNTQGVLTMHVGGPDDRQTKSVDFALDEADLHGENLCRIAVMLAGDGEPSGTSGPAASVTMTTDHPDFDKVFTSGIADPIALQTRVGEIVPEQAWNEIWTFYSEWSGKPGR